MSFKPINTKIPEIINEKNFNIYGGKALGLIALDYLKDRLKTFEIPSYYIIKNQYSINDLKEDIFHQEYSMKTSTFKDDFSIYSKRGINSTKGNITKLSDITLKEITELITDNKIVILQKFLRDNDFFFLLHFEKNECIIEIVYKEDKLIVVVFNHKGQIISLENTFETFKYTRKIYSVLITIFKVAKNVKNNIGFNINLEGFYKEKNIFLIQLRSIPLEYNIKEFDSFKLRNIKFILKTYMTYNIFNISLKNFKLIELNNTLENTQQNSIHYIFINTKNESPLKHPVIINRLKKNISTYIINTKWGFKLSHSPNELPININERKYYFTITLKLFNKKEHSDCKIISNGHIAYLFKH